MADYGQARNEESAREILEALESLGDLRPNEAAELDRLRGAASSNQQEIGATGATYRGALQGATFQQADELYGLFGGDKEAARLKNLEAELAYPSEYQKGKMAGAVGSSAALGAVTSPLTTAKTLTGIAARSGVLGGLEGVLWGSGGGDNTEEKLREAGKYGLWGAGLGVAAPFAVAAGSAATRAAGDLAGGLVNVGNKARAQRSVMDMLRKAGLSVSDATDDIVRATTQGQPEYRLMDAAGKAGQRRASGIVRAGGDGAEELAQFLEQRAIDAPDRMLGFVDDAFGTRGTTAAKTVDTLKKNRRTVANAMYSQASADAAPVDVRGTVAILDDTIDKMSNSGIKPPAVVKEYEKLRKKLAGIDPDGNTTTLSDYDSVLGIWREVRDNVDKAYKAGDGAIGEALKPVRDSLQQSLEESSDLYRFATDNYRAHSDVINAVETGADAARKGGRYEDTISEFNALTDQQKRAARVGYGDTLSAKIAGKQADAPNVPREVSSRKRAEEINAMAIDPALMNERTAREKAMFGTYQRAIGGSRTADNLQDIADVGAIADAGRAARDAATGNVPGALSNVGNAVARKATGQNDATREIIAKILMSNDPEVALQSAMRAEANSQTRRRIAEAIVRSLGREVTP